MAKNGKISEELSQDGYVQKDGTCKGKEFKESSNLEFYNLKATTFKQLQDANIFSRLNFADDKDKLKRLDAFIKMKGDNSRAVVVIEHKKPGSLNSPKKEQEALEQNLKYCQITGAKIGVITDGAKFLWINGLSDKNKIQRIKHDDGHDLNLQFDLNESLPISTLTIIERLDQDLTKTNSRLSKIKTINPINLANKTWQTIWITKKTTPKKSLLTFVEFFMFKFLSDIGVLTGPHSFSHLAGLDPEDQLEHYINTVRKHIKKMFPEAHHGLGHFKDDKTTIINGFPLNQNITGDVKIFAQIVKDLSPHSLKNLDPEFKSHLYEIFMKDDRNSLNQMGQFFTPRSIIRTMVKMSEIEQLPDGSKVCDPACGVGGFLLEPLIELRKNEFNKDSSGKIKSKITYHGFDVRDSQEDLLTTILAKANFVIHASDAIQANSKRTGDFADVMNEMFKCYTEANAGSLSELYPENYQLILSNPPYVSSGSATIKEEVNWSQVSSQGLEGMFLEKICRELAPGGRAFIVLPDGIFFRDADKPLREYLFNNCKIEGIVSLPQSAFFNTPKKTNILIIRKLNKGEKLVRYKVFGFFVKDIGESLDADRLPTDQNDLPDLEREFRVFTALSKAGLADEYKPQSDKVVIFESDSFKDGSSQGWNIDRRISDEQKEKMGFEIKRVEEITYDQFKAELLKIAEELTILAKG